MDRDFGAIGDGASSTRDTTAFLAFNAWASGVSASNSDAVIQVSLEKGGKYLVADPRWPMNIKRLRTLGLGASIKNTATEPNLRMLLLPSYGLLNPSPGPGYGAVTRSLVSSTAVNDRTLQLTTIAEAANYAVGKTVMLASYSIQWDGFPPSYRLFEFPIITAINLGTGVLTLDRPVRYAHLSTFPRLTPNDYSEGRAHIEKIEQGGMWDIYHEYHDIHFVKNDVPTLAITEAPYSIGRNVQFFGCTADYLLATMNEFTGRYDCTVNGAFEFDKIVSVYDGKRNVYKGIVTSATSVGRLREERTGFEAGYRLGPGTLELVDCDVTAPSADAVELFPANGFVDTLKITGGNHQFYPKYSRNVGQTNTVIDGTAGAVWTGATSKLTLDFSVSMSAAQFFTYQAFAGAIVAITASAGGSEKPTGLFGKVTAIEATGNGTCDITINFNGVVPALSRFTIFPEPRHVDINGERNYCVIIKDEYSLKNLLVTSAYTLLNVPAFGQVTSFECEVLRGYTGATAGNIVLQAYDAYPVFTRFTKSIDLRTTGSRIALRVGNAGFSGAAGESAGANLATGAFDATVSSIIELGASVMASTGNNQLPLVNIKLKFSSPYVP